MAGKTTLLSKILLHRHKKVHAAIKDENGEWQSQTFDTPEKEAGVKFYSTFPTKQQIAELVQNDKKQKPKTTILIFDDWMSHIYKSEDVIGVLTKMVHHLNLLVYIMQQALYPRSVNAIASRPQVSGFFSFHFSAEHNTLCQWFHKFLTDKQDVNVVLEYYKSKIASRGGYLFVYLHPKQSIKYRFWLYVTPEEGLTERFIP